VLLTAALTKLGGSVQRHCAARGIRLEGGRVSGVVTESRHDQNAHGGAGRRRLVLLLLPAAHHPHPGHQRRRPCGLVSRCDARKLPFANERCWPDRADAGLKFIAGKLPSPVHRGKIFERTG
jgi:hypothetical protein